jgi:outer membrane protein assembly factor BamB
VVRYLQTLAGAEALLRLGTIHRDRGRPRDAALCWERLQGLPHAAGFEPMLSIRLAEAWDACGEPARSRKVIERLARAHPRAQLRLAGDLHAWSDGAVAAVMERLRTDAPTHQDRAASPVSGGNTSPPQQVDAGDPLLVPRWSRLVTDDAAIRGAIEQTVRTSVDLGLPRLPMLSPAIVGDLLLDRTGDAVRAFDLRDGRPLWTCALDASSDLAARLWTDSAHGSLSADAEAFYAVETASAESLIGMEAAPEPAMLQMQQVQQMQMMMQLRMRNMMWGLAGPRGVPSEATLEFSTQANLLSARALRPPQEGNLRWRVGGSDGRGEPLLAGMSFLASPLPYAGRVYALGERRGTIHLIVLEADSGRLDWLQPLATVPRPVDADPFRRTVGAAPAVAGDVVVCPTSGGGTVAADLVLRSLLWVYRYPRREASVFAPDEGNIPVLDQRDRWIDPSATIVGERVLLTPPESEHLHCLDLRTGKLLWRRDRDSYLFIAAVHKEQVVLVGPRRVFALRLDNGKPSWTIPVTLPGNALPSGRGIHAGRSLYLPLSNASVAVLDLEVGWLSRTLRSPRETVLGNLVYHDGVFLSQGATSLDVFDELEPLRERIEQALRADPHDAESLARLGQIELAAGRLEPALSAFRRAWQASPSPRNRHLLSAALFDALRAMPERQAEFNAELDQLAQ